MALHNWMDQMDDDLRFNQIVFPATHDSGMSFQSWQSAYNAINPLAYVVKPLAAIAGFFVNATNSGKHTLHQDNFVTQSLDIAGQLANGARQLDLRITNATSTRAWHAYHGEAAQVVAGLRAFGESWESICNGIGGWWRNNPSEVLVLKMDKQSKGDAEALMGVLSNALKAIHGGGGGNTCPLLGYVDQWRLRGLRGRILVCGKPSFTDTCNTLGGMHSALTFCDWGKFENGVGIVGAVTDNRPVYVLLGSSEGGLSKYKNVLEKQEEMKKLFQGQTASRTTASGMRGIWFNTFSLLSDIRTYSDEIWNSDNQDRRDRLWLANDSIQNVASVDFLEAEKAKYVIGQNPDRNWKTNGRATLDQ